LIFESTKISSAKEKVVEKISKYNSLGTTVNGIIESTEEIKSRIGQPEPCIMQKRS